MCEYQNRLVSSPLVCADLNSLFVQAILPYLMIKEIRKCGLKNRSEILKTT